MSNRTKRRSIAGYSLQTVSPIFTSKITESWIVLFFLKIRILLTCWHFVGLKLCVAYTLTPVFRKLLNFLIGSTGCESNPLSAAAVKCARDGVTQEWKACVFFNLSFSLLAHLHELQCRRSCQYGTAWFALPIAIGSWYSPQYELALPLQRTVSSGTSYCRPTRESSEWTFFKALRARTHK